MALVVKKKKAAEATPELKSDLEAAAIEFAKLLGNAHGFDVEAEIAGNVPRAIGTGDETGWPLLYRLVAQWVVKTRQDAIAEAYEPANELIRKLTALGVSKAEIADAM